MVIIYINILVREVFGMCCNFKDLFLLVFIVKLFGYIFVMSFFVILGLICFLILKRRCGSLFGKLMIVL